MTKRVIGLSLAVIAILAAPKTTFAQSPVKKGSVEVSGSTGVVASFDTIGQADQADDLELRNIAAGAGIFFYMSSRLGIGVAGTYGRLNLGAGDSDITATNTTIGPAVRFRFGGSNTELSVTGGAGLANTKFDVSGSDFGSGQGEAFSSSGFYWTAGADAAFFVRDNIAFTLGARYQASKVKDEADIEFDVSGFSFTAGFSLFFHR